MMCKQALIGATLLAVSSVGFTMDNGGNSTAPDLYVGMGILSDNGRVKNVTNTNIDVGMNGTAGEALIGYGWRWHNFLYTSLEVWGQLSSNKGTFIGFNRRQESSLGARVLQGFRVADSTMIFANFGYARTRFISDSPFTGRTFDPNGYQVGAGLQTWMNCHVSLRGGWNLNTYTNIFDGTGRLYNNQFYLDAIYHFMV